MAQNPEFGPGLRAQSPGPDPGPGPQLIFAGGPTICSYATAFTKWSKKPVYYYVLVFFSSTFQKFFVLLFGGGPYLVGAPVHVHMLHMPKSGPG